MEKYIARSGENIFDIAINLSGSIEGVFVLLACNPWLTINTEIGHGDEIYYEESYIVNNDIKRWMEENNVKARNGHHVYGYVNIERVMTESIDRYNSNVVLSAQEKWPGVYEDGKFLTTSLTPDTRAFLQYIRTNYIGSGSTELEMYAENCVSFGRFGTDGLQEPSIDEQAMWLEKITAMKIVINQIGEITAITAKMDIGGIMVIDWGDATYPESHFSTDGEFTTEHNYVGDGIHKIIIYGNFHLEKLDLTEINGTYYPTSAIPVKDFRTNINNETINKLILIQQ